MELRHLRYFVAVAEELHFSRAAARLHIAQPPLSQQIRHLEHELEVALFTRTRRRVELTAAGRAFLDEARSVLEQADRAARIARRVGGGQIGHLSIGFVPSADLDLLPRVLRVWQRRYPDVELELQVLFAAAQIDALLAGRIQVGLVRLPLTPQRGLVVERVQSEPLVVALPRRHRLARRRAIRLPDLAGDTLLLFPRHVAPGYYDVLMGAFEGAGLTPRVFHPGTLQTNLALISAGIGITLLPASIRNLRRAGVVYRPLAAAAPTVELAVVYREDERSPTVPAFVDLVRSAARGSTGRRG
ncbi:MAG TPA: LysR substrate-binding domain-containing protein [Candidatus Binatia bacterium]|jgi:DNA-binding transcriptional LysR family regulator|nr:LysR substrate-binding domain-containing protein [Candidatus Binatia bacterium]